MQFNRRTKSTKAKQNSNNRQQQQSSSSHNIKYILLEAIIIIQCCTYSIYSIDLVVVVVVVVVDWCESISGAICQNELRVDVRMIARHLHTLWCCSLPLFVQTKLTAVNTDADRNGNEIERVCQTNKKKMRTQITQTKRSYAAIGEADVDDGEDEDDDMVDRNINRLHLLHRQNVRMSMKLGERATWRTERRSDGDRRAKRYTQ